jgi:arylsulfatase A-like enzyme
MPRPPNFLFFMTDQQQAQTVEPGHPCATPHAERLAREGLRFTQARTPTAHCCPARATFVSGLYPSRHGVFNNVLTDTAIHLSLNEGVVTFGEVLKEAGYRLAWSGKWHVTATEGPGDRAAGRNGT